MKKNQIKKVIFIVTDTLRAQNVGLYGANPSPTPNIDALGKKGVVFSNAYTTVTKTDPSITSIMTGRYPLSAGLVNHGSNVEPTEERGLKGIPFLAEILKSHGYKTLAVDWLGRWYRRGFQYYSGKIIKSIAAVDLAMDKLPFFFYLRLLDKIAMRYLKRDFILRFYYAFFPNPLIPYDPADVVVDKAIVLLKKYRQQQRFLYLHLWDAHIPHTRSRGLKSFMLDIPEDTYEAEVKFLDQELGRLFSYLKTTNQLDDTLIVLTSDHGENFLNHDRPFNHEGLYDDVVKVPLLISHQSFAPRKIDSLVQTIDIFATILDILNISIPEDIDSRSLAGLMSGQKRQIRDAVYFEDILIRKFKINKNTIRRRGIRVGDYKYIQTLSGKERELHTIMPNGAFKISSEELFNLKNDPQEQKNLIKTKPKVKRELRNKLNQNIQLMNNKRLKLNRSLLKKIRKSIATIRESVTQFRNQDIAVAWTGGKDSTVLLHLVKMAFGGKIPFKVFFNDSTMEFEEIYNFIEKIGKLWNIDLITVKHSEEELKEFRETKSREKQKELSRIMKITAINSALKQHKIKAFMVGIRWDEHESRSKEKYFSSRSNHMRIHPILHFTEKDIWEYTNFFGVPYVDLYTKGYRSLGEKQFTKKARPGEDERSGREKDKEQLMGRLRKMGYW